MDVWGCSAKLSEREKMWEAVMLYTVLTCMALCPVLLIGIFVLHAMGVLP